MDSSTVDYSLLKFNIQLELTLTMTKGGVVALLVLLQVVQRGLGLDLHRIRPIYESAFWRETHPALAKLIAKSESAAEALGASLNIQARVTGGEIAVNNQFPYQAGLVITLPSQQSFCGGSLISSNFVLTAGHCLDTSTMATVLLGAHDVSMASENTRAIQLIMARNFRIHESYNSTQYQNDIALLQLNAPVQVTSAIQIIALPRWSQVDTTFTNSRATVSGWGRYLDTVDEFSTVLRYVDLTVLDNSGCTPFFGVAVTNMKVCTSGAGRVGPCGGECAGFVRE